MDCMNKVLTWQRKVNLDRLTRHIFHIHLYPSHRKYLRFCIQDKAYQFNVIALGPKSSLRFFHENSISSSRVLENAKFET